MVGVVKDQQEGMFRRSAVVEQEFVYAVEQLPLILVVIEARSLVLGRGVGEIGRGGVRGARQEREQTLEGVLVTSDQLRRVLLGVAECPQVERIQATEVAGGQLASVL